MAVRREKVILDLEDNFSSKMARAAAATALLDKQLDKLDGSAVGTARSVDKTTRATKDYSVAAGFAEQKTARFSRETDRLSTSAVHGSRSIDRLSGRLRIFADLAAVLGPSLVPIAAVGVPAVTGLANQFGFAAIAAGVAVFAFQGIGDTLKAVNDAAIEPTAENLKKARQAMQELSPAGRDMVRQLQELRPLITGLRDTAQGGLFPGVIEGLESLERLAPRIDTIIGVVSDSLGDLFADGAESLAGDRWADFFSALAVEARPALEAMASAIGSLVHGLGELWIAFSPLNRDFGSWLADSAADFDRWAEGLSQTVGFQEFVDYIRENGPKVAEATGAIGNAIVQIVQAVAPLGGPSLKIIEVFADAIASIADSDIGTPIFAGVAALALLNRSLQVTAALQRRLTGSTALAAGGAASGGLFGAYRTGTTNVRQFTHALVPLRDAQDRARRGTAAWAEEERKRQAVVRSGLGSMSKAAALAGGLAVATTGIGDSIGLSNTLMGAAFGSIIPGWGTAIGAAAGFALDFAAANDDVFESLKALDGLTLSNAGGLTGLRGALQGARADLDAFQQQVDLSNPDLAPSLNPFANIGDKLSATKNWTEGLFGESDAEEAQAQFDAAAVAINQTEEAARGLADAMGVDIFGSQSAQLQQLDAVLTQVQPAMDRLGVTLQDWQNAAQAQAIAQNFEKLFGPGIMPDETLHALDLFNAAIAQESRELDRVARREAKVQRLNAALRAQRDAAQQAAQGFVDLGRKAKASEFTLDGWLDKLERQTEAMRRFRENAIAAGQRGLRQGLIRHLRELGPEGALQLARLADASEKELRRANRWWDSYQRAGRQANQTVAEMVEESSRRAKDAFNKLPKDVKTEIRATRIPETEAEIDRLVEKYKLTEKERRALVSLTDNASGKIQDVLGLLARADGAHAESTITVTTQLRTVRIGNDTAGGPVEPRGGIASGGTVPGPRYPYRDKVLAYLAPGEEVITNRHGEADQFRADRAAGRIPRYADGGRIPSGLPPILTRGRDNETQRETRETTRALKGLRGELKHATAALEKERKQRDALIDKMKSTSSDVSSGLRTDLFGDHDVWAGDTSPTGILRGDLANARAMREAIRDLRKKGLTGSALAEVLSQGGLAGAQAYADMSRAELREYAQLYNQRNRVLRSVGDLAGNASFGAALRDSRREYRELKQEVREVKNAIDRASGRNDKNHKEDRKSQQRGAGRGRRSQRRD